MIVTYTLYPFQTKYLSFFFECCLFLKITRYPSIPWDKVNFVLFSTTWHLAGQIGILKFAACFKRPTIGHRQYLLPLIVLLSAIFYYFKIISFISQITIRKEFVDTILILLTQASIKLWPNFLCNKSKPLKKKISICFACYKRKLHIFIADVLQSTVTMLNSNMILLSWVV